jgi:hypothetical protein
MHVKRTLLEALIHNVVGFQAAAAVPVQINNTRARRIVDGSGGSVVGDVVAALECDVTSILHLRSLQTRLWSLPRNDLATIIHD